MPDFGGLIGSFYRAPWHPPATSGWAVRWRVCSAAAARHRVLAAVPICSAACVMRQGGWERPHRTGRGRRYGGQSCSLLGGGSDSIKGALGGGALAMLASVAMKSLAANSGGSNGNPAAAFAGQFSTDTGVSPAPQSVQATAELVLRGMINIAKSDGEISREESQRIVGKILETSQLDEDSRQWLAREMQKPLDLRGLAADIPNPRSRRRSTPRRCSQSRSTPWPKQYLEQFARPTGLSPQVVQQIHQAMGLGNLNARWLTTASAWAVWPVRRPDRINDNEFVLSVGIGGAPGCPVSVWGTRPEGAGRTAGGRVVGMPGVRAAQARRGWAVILPWRSGAAGWMWMDRARIGVHRCTAGGRVTQRLLTGRQLTLPKPYSRSSSRRSTFTFQVFT